MPKEAIRIKYLTQGAYKYHYTQHGWQENIDLALAQDLSLTILWQNKALPYWKTKKYDLVIAYYNQAVK